MLQGSSYDGRSRGCDLRLTTALYKLTNGIALGMVIESYVK